MPPLRQRLVRAAFSVGSWSTKVSLQWSAELQRSGPVQRLLRGSYLFSRRHPVPSSNGMLSTPETMGTDLDSINEVTHHMVIVGYLAYGTKEPTILDVGCGQGRLLQLLADSGFTNYLGIDWSRQAIEYAESLSIPHTRFEVANMDHWDTTERFDAVVLNESLYYSSELIHV